MTAIMEAQDGMPRRGRRPSKDFDNADEVMAFGCYENMVDMQQAKIAQAKADAKKKSSGALRRVPDRTCSSDSQDDYHKNMFSTH